MRPLKLFIELLLLVAPFVASAQVDHSHKWSNNLTALTYNLIDLDNFAVGDYGYCKWGNLQDRLDIAFETDLDFTKLTALPYSNSNTDLFLANDSPTSLQAYGFPSWTVWNSDNSLSIGSDYSIRLYRYLHFRNELVDAATGSPLTGNETKLIILFHGWNPDSNSDAYAGSEFATLVNNLKAVTNGTDWKVVKYRWEADSDTGSVIDAVLSPDALINNATEAAEISNQHGQHLGQLLTEQFVSLQKVHVIAHSAGSWAARGTLRYLLDKAPNVSCQMTLLDPFMPNSTETTIDSSLGTAVMSQFDNTFSANRSTRLGPLENYYANTLTTPGTQEVFAWANTDRNLRIDWSSYYQTHAGPIAFYADTIARFYNPSLSIPSLDAFDLRSDPYTGTQIGWNNSFFLNEPIFTSQPQSQSISETSTLTLTAQATTRKNIIRSGSATTFLTWRWFKDNQYLTSTTTPILTIPTVKTSNSGKYHAEIYDAAYPANRTTSQDADVTVIQAQTITFATLSAKPYGAAPFVISATATSELSPTFSIVSGPAILSGSTITLTGVGIVIVRASQNGNASYAAATPVDRSFVVTQAPQTITFAALSAKTYGNAPFTVNATATSGLTPTFSIVSGPATISGNTVTLTGSGTVTVRASQAGNINYLAAASVDRSFIVSKPLAQTIKFTAPKAKLMGVAPFDLVATATSGLPVTFSVVSGPVTLGVNGKTLTVTGAGTVVLQATQSGNTVYLPAKAVQASFKVSQTAQKITFKPASSALMSSPPLTLTATASSGLPVSFAVVSGPATLGVDGHTLTFTAAGSVVLRATQPGNAVYLAAPAVQATIKVSKVAQTITFSLPTTVTLNASPLTLTATASSGLPVTFVVTGPATLSGQTLTLTGVGTVSVSASQAGNAIFLAAKPVVKKIKVTAASTKTKSLASKSSDVMPLSSLAGDYEALLEGAAASSASGLPVGRLELRLADTKGSYTALLTLPDEAEPLLIFGTVKIAGTASNPLITAYWPEPDDVSPYAVEFTLSGDGLVVTVSKAGQIIAETNAAVMRP